MNKEEIEKYQGLKVSIGLSNSETFNGFVKKCDDKYLFLENPMCESEIVLALEKIISIRVRHNFWERQRRFFFRK
jgi:hypothetical protein